MKPNTVDAFAAAVQAAIQDAPVVQHSRGVNGIATKAAIAKAVERVIREHAEALAWLADR